LPVAAIHRLANSTGEYHNPPSAKVTIAASELATKALVFPQTFVGIGPEGIEELFPEYLTRVDGTHFVAHGHGPSVIVDDLNIFGSVRCPSEADAVTIFDSDAVLPMAISMRSFEAVPRRRAQVVEGRSAIEHQQLALCACPEGAERSVARAAKEGFRLLAAE
jgi:hypothetical protein